ncbi:MAG: hypothetical protein ACLT4C_09465, partial [Butyricicoccus sp.]
SRFLAINKNGSEREELSSSPPMMVVIIALRLFPDKIQMCQNRIYNSFIIVQSDNSHSSIPQKLTTYTKTRLFFRQTRVCFLRFYAEIRENRFTNGRFHGNIYILSPRA